MKHHIVIISLACILIVSPKPKAESTKVLYIDYNSATNVTSLLTQKEMEKRSGDSVELVLDEWKTFADKVYVPTITEKFEVKRSASKNSTAEVINSNKDLIQKYIENNKVNLNFVQALQILNPTLNTSVFKDGLNMSYGVTQINVKLIPMAKIYFPDFETNINSQLKFLDFYLNQKFKSGYSLDKIIQHYKYAKY